jgi:hypothetical protein
MRRVLTLTLALTLAGGGFLAGWATRPVGRLSGALTACYEQGLDEGNRQWAEEVTEWESIPAPEVCR